MSILARIQSLRLVIASFALLLCCGLAAAGLLWQQEQSDFWVRHTVQVQVRLAQARVLGLRAEVARRGFALSGNEDELVGFASVRSATEQNLRSLAAMTADNPHQLVNVAALRRAIAERFASMDRTITLVRRGRIDDARQIIDSSASRDLAALIAARADRVNNEEARLLVQREQRLRDQESLAGIVLASAVMMILILAAVVWRDRLWQLRALATVNDHLADDICKREFAEAQLQLLATNATDAVFRLGLDGRFTYASPSTRHVFGIDPEYVIGREVSWGVHPEDIAAVAASMKLLASGQRDRLLVTYRSARPDLADAWRWVESNAGVVRDRDGHPVEVIASLRDISIRKQLEFDLKASRLRAETAAEAKSSFLANMSHEIRTPMNGVIGFTELLLASDLSPDQRRHAELIADSGRAMMRLLNDILDLSKVEAGQMRIADDPFDIRHTLRACQRLVTPAVEQKGLTLHVDIADDLPTAIRGDGLRLRQIVLNLLGNAAKFTLQGTVTLRALTVQRGGDGASDATLLIEVEDTGIGIPPERRAAVFDTFVQADAGTASRFGGTGLGLPISARLAELMGGRLLLDDTCRQGSRFILFLPLVATELEQGGTGLPAVTTNSSAPLKDHATRRSSRILVAEDHDVNQLLITAMLRQLGHDPVLAADGAEAIAMVEAAQRAGQPYSLVLMDIQMPVMDGPEATRQLRQAGFSADQLPIVALTANAYADDVATCLSAGMQAHLAKPVTLASLDNVIDQWSRQSREATASAIRPTTAQPSARVRELYRVRKEEALHALAELVRRGSFAEAELDDVAGLLHKLAGTAAMFGETVLGDHARALEEGLTKWMPDTRPDRIRAAVEAIHAVA